MSADLLWGPQAREDLLEIYIAIGLDNPDAAERLYTAMEEKANLLVGHPRLECAVRNLNLRAHSDGRGVSAALRDPSRRRRRAD